MVYKDWTSGRLHAYEKCRRSCASPSRLTRERYLEGRALLPKRLKWERAERSRLRPSAKPQLADTVKLSRVIHNVMLLSSECQLDGDVQRER